MMRDLWQRWRWFWHAHHGGILPLSQKDGSIAWRCWCGTMLGRTDLSDIGRRIVEVERDQ